MFLKCILKHSHQFLEILKVPSYLQRIPSQHYQLLPQLSYPLFQSNAATMHECAKTPTHRQLFPFINLGGLFLSTNHSLHFTSNVTSFRNQKFFLSSLFWWPLNHIFFPLFPFIYYCSGWFISGGKRSLAQC